MQTTETKFTKQQAETLIKKYETHYSIKDITAHHDILIRVIDKDGDCTRATKIIIVCANDMTPREQTSVAYRFKHTDMDRDFIRTIHCGCHQGDIEGFTLDSVESLMIDNVK